METSLGQRRRPHGDGPSESGGRAFSFETGSEGRGGRRVCGEAQPRPSRPAVQVLRGGACSLRGAPWSPVSGQCPLWGSLVLMDPVTRPPRSEGATEPPPDSAPP